MPSLFTRIIRGEIPAHFIHKDESCIAFLTINPITTGHTLVVPTEEVDQWTDLSYEATNHLMVIANRIGNAQKHLYDCARIGLIVAGFEIPHCHLHVLPTNSISDLSFANAAQHVEESILQREAEKLAAVLRTI